MILSSIDDDNLRKIAMVDKPKNNWVMVNCWYISKLLSHVHIIKLNDISFALN